MNNVTTCLVCACVLLASCTRPPTATMDSTTNVTPSDAPTARATATPDPRNARPGESATHVGSGDASFTVFRNATSITRIVRPADRIEYEFRGPHPTSITRPDGRFTFADARLATWTDERGQALQADAAAFAEREATLLAEARSYWLRAQSLSWRASGNEPFWALRIGEQVVFERPGEEPIERPLTTPSEGGGRVVYILPGESRREMIEIVFQDIPCVDSMAGTPWRHRAEVIYRGQSYSGCGAGAED